MLLPHRDGRVLPPDLSTHARTLVEQFRLDAGLHQLRVPAGSALIGTARAALEFSQRDDVTLVTVRESDGQGARLGPLQADDVLVVRGEGEAIAALASDLGLRLRDDHSDAREIEDHLFNRASGLAEVVIPRARR